MRLTRIAIVSLFIFFFAFGIQSRVFAQAACTPQTNDPNYSNCMYGGAGYFYSHQAPPIDCKAITCSASYTPGAFPGQLSKEVTTYVSNVAAAYGVNNCVSRTSETNGMMVKMNKGGYDNLSIGNLLADPVCRIGGCGCTLNGLTYVGPPPANEQIAYNQNGVMNSMVNATSAIAVLPVSSSDYVADVIQTIQNPLGAQQAYAQGLGFSSLKPVLGLWKLFRNVAYFFFVIIFIVIGFLIMFRSKIGGQAAVTIQQALPKIIVALLLVTFSYAIAGFMIDIMYLIIYLMIAIFSAEGTLKSADLVKIAFTDHLFANISNLLTGGVIGTIGGSIANAVSSMLVDSGWKEATASFAGLGANIIFQLVMLIALLVNMFRLFFALLQAYVMVLFSVVFAPIQLLMGALPGQNTFGTWLKGLLSNLMAFPVVIFFLLCARYFAVTKFGTDGTGGFAAPQLGLQYGGGADAGKFILAILQFGILALIPKAIEIAKGAVSGKLDIDPGKAMGEMWKQGGGSALTKTALMAPLGAAGAYLGYKYASGRADELGLKGRARFLTQLGGIAGGGGMGMNLHKAARTVMPGVMGQLGQAEVARMFKETKGFATKTQTEAATAQVQNTAQGTINDIKAATKNATTPTPPTRATAPTAPSTKNSRNRGF